MPTKLFALSSPSSFTRILCICLCALLGLAGVAHAETAAETAAADTADTAALATARAAFDAAVTELLAQTPDAASMSDGPLAGLAYLVGWWQVEGTWAGGAGLRAKAEYRPLLGGKFLYARTLVQDGDGGVYERYNTIFGAKASADGAEGSQTLNAYGFTYDGSVAVTEMELSQGDDGLPVLTAQWGAGGQELKQSVEGLDADHMRWQVWVRVAGIDGDWTQIMDAVWQRVE